MAKHRQQVLKYPFRIYKHYYGNQWHFFVKPRMKKKLARLISNIKRVINK